MYTISVRATELERSYPYGIVRQTADSVQLDKSDEDRAALFTGRGEARAADPRSGWRRGRPTTRS